jgi:hyperosmotically inducible protein
MRIIIALLSFYVFFIVAGPQTAFAASTKDAANGRERTGPTASDQSENEADRKITQQIRQAVTKDDSLSTSAQNVTIVTQEGKVTLRGTVKSESEKQKIAEKAKEVSGVKNVDNQIAVRQ